VTGNGGSFWEQVQLLRAVGRDDLDVFFAVGYSAPLALHRPTVVLVHDMAFEAHPEWFRWREGARRRFFTRKSTDRASLVLTVSEFSRREIVSRLGLPEARVRCVYPGVECPGPTDVSEPNREPLVLYVGSVFNRRRLPDLIRAFKLVAIRVPGARLEIVGDNRTHPHEDLKAIATNEGLAERIGIRSYVPDAELAGLYRRASAFAFLSEYEGFGHPPLEALTCGVPGVLLDTGVARETCGDAALYVKRGDLQATAAALTSLLVDPAVHKRILSRAPTVLGRYSWKDAASKTLEALESVFNSAGPHPRDGAARDPRRSSGR
jgi:glycosyltransferase involved in cell wall biosynthesis